jgi:hypothetical protein
MPAGSHAVLDQVRQAIEERARRLLAQLQELVDEPAIKGIDDRLATKTPAQKAITATS